ncbi:MAG TPA: sulfatase-like hydrolase/transferase, partial [Anaerolineae bacterium]|nr:sulfatase-like hydrolase/transferase [Anaerolineae bacterium]
SLQGFLTPGANPQNVLIVVFDAWSARNVSLYGYGRQTTPNIDRLAQRAIVYRNHQASANFTTTGTASLLTGAHGWTHRALGPEAPTTAFFHRNNMFSLFAGYYRFAYTQNSWVQALLTPMSRNLELLPNVIDLYLQARPVERLFPNDSDTASVAASRVANPKENYGYSLFRPMLLKAFPPPAAPQGITELFPRGMPNRYDGVSAFTIETAMDWLVSEITKAPRPFLAYLHLLPPHAPYCARVEFVDRFKGDGFVPVAKPIDSLSLPSRYKNVEWQQGLQRRLYDEYIMYADAEFGRLFGILEATGMLDTTWLVLTSDHGETFERGFIGHRTKTLFQPEIQVPLLIFEPGRTNAVVVNEATSAVDLLPTLAHVTGNTMPAWTDGTIMPPFSGRGAANEHAVYSIQAQDTRTGGPITRATVASVRWPHKLQYYSGYEQIQGKLIKLFDLARDPEELHDLANEMPDVASDLLRDLEHRMALADQQY